MQVLHPLHFLGSAIASKRLLATPSVIFTLSCLNRCPNTEQQHQWQLQINWSTSAWLSDRWTRGYRSVSSTTFRASSAVIFFPAPRLMLYCATRPTLMQTWTGTEHSRVLCS